VTARTAEEHPERGKEQAGSVVGELALELQKRELRIRQLLPGWIVAVCRTQSVNLLDRSDVVKYLYIMTQAEAIKGIRKAARRRDRADASRREARDELKRYCLEAQAAGVSVSEIARASGLSRQGVYGLLGQSPFQ
jgi:hypothetical protein